MNHPKQEEWVPYLFGEAKPEERRRLDEHLQTCAACHNEITAWQRSLKRLDAWKVPALERPRILFEPVLKWALAAAVVMVLSAGFAVGRLTAASDVAKVRAAIEPQLRQQLRQEFADLLSSQLNQAANATLEEAGEQAQVLVAEYADAVANQQAEDTQAVYAALSKLEAEHLADYVALKRDVDTLAVNTDAGLRHTEQQLVQLADATPAVSSPEAAQK